MATDEQLDGSLEDLNILLSTLDGLDERGLVVSLASFAEQVLALLLAAFLRKNRSARELLATASSPLGSLSAKLKACHALGLITDEQFSDLEHLRKMRNDFAHSWKRLSLSGPPFQARIAALSFPASHDAFPTTPREKVTQSLSFLLVELTIRADQIVQNGEQARLLGRRLIAGFVGSPDEQRDKLSKKLAAIDAELPTATGEKLRYLEAAKQHCLALEAQQSAAR